MKIAKENIEKEIRETKSEMETLKNPIRLAYLEGVVYAYWDSLREIEHAIKRGGIKEKK